MGAIIDIYLPMSSTNMTFTWEHTQMQNLPLNNENSKGCIRIQIDSPRNFGLKIKNRECSQKEGRKESF